MDRAAPLDHPIKQTAEPSATPSNRVFLGAMTALALAYAAGIGYGIRHVAISAQSSMSSDASAETPASAPRRISGLGLALAAGGQGGLYATGQAVDAQAMLAAIPEVARAIQKEVADALGAPPAPGPDSPRAKPRP